MNGLTDSRVMTSHLPSATFVLNPQIDRLQLDTWLVTPICDKLFVQFYVHDSLSRIHGP
jgi:hypothetical protein